MQCEVLNILLHMNVVIHLSFNEKYYFYSLYFTYIERCYCELQYISTRNILLESYVYNKIQHTIRYVNRNFRRKGGIQIVTHQSVPTLRGCRPCFHAGR